MKFSPSDIAQFAESTGMPLYPYQLEVAQAILDSILHQRGYIFTVMMARQSGKNQLSAMLEAFLLSQVEQGTIVKAAPTFNPQITISRLRLLSVLSHSDLRESVWQGAGRMVGLAPDGDNLARRHQQGPRVMFLSAAPGSNVVGATADLLLEIDEAQDIAHEKFDRDFRPMAATTSATTILYGTAWTETTLLAQQRAVNIEDEQRIGKRLHFEYDWQTLATFNSAYARYVEQEIARLGTEHIAIQTQYLLKPIKAMDRLFNDTHLLLLQGNHAWESAPHQNSYYIAAMDVAGEERQTANPLHEIGIRPERSRHDSTVISIARLRPDDVQGTIVEIVHQICWTGMKYDTQLQTTVALMKHWQVRTLIVDATGLGGPVASMLRDRLGEERVQPFTFTRASKSRLAYRWLALINGGRFKMYQRESAPHNEKVAGACWKQLQLAQYRVPAPDILDIYVDPAQGHDDILISLAMLAEIADTHMKPAYSALVRPRHFYTRESRF